LKHTVPIITDVHMLQRFIPLVYAELLAKNNCRTKVSGAWLRKHAKTFGTSLLISATVETINFKFGKQP